VFKITRHDATGPEFSAPEGYYFKEAHLIGSDRFAVFWEGRPTPPSLVKLCNQLVRTRYIDDDPVHDRDRTLFGLIEELERELNAQGLRELV
jgi:hypothetical protein